jgi:predicted enzyme related to lactoylglutathione lyase
LTLALFNVTIDARSPADLARFWSAVLGYALVEDIDGLARLRGPQTQGAPDLLFMHVHEPTPGKNRWHVDLSADDVDAELDRLLSLGATLSSRHTEHGKTWAVFHDPEGNTFCLGANPT